MTNKRKVRCARCKVSLAAGQGVGYSNEFGYGGHGNYYYCQSCAEARAKLDADEPAIRRSLAQIAEYLKARLDCRGGLDSGWAGWVSCVNDGSVAYGRMRNLVDSAGVYALDVSTAIVAALTERQPATVAEIVATAEQSAIQTLQAHRQRGRALTWVSSRLAAQAVGG